MPEITMTITLDVPDGTSIAITTNNAGEVDRHVEPDVLDTIQRLVPARYREWVELYIERCVAELGCSAALPGGGRQDYLNIFPPPRCRRARVSSVTYSSSRTAVFTGAIDLDGFTLAQQTMNSGRYAYPKLPHLDGADAVNEAVELTRRAVARVER